ncbi:MAG: hypothetical protein OEY87_01970 [Gammaproteobacteria bacterium]|nr:hypothetical protein [Gammaproteobacteria bacterium]
MKHSFEEYFLPLSAWLAHCYNNKPVIVGLNGAQGSGKSTLAKVIALILEKGFNKSVLSLSIDDLYKTREQRLLMSKTVHPLFITRGVPGTHDVLSGIQLFSRLKTGEKGIAVPAFDKAVDDRVSEKCWHIQQEAVDIVIFEGWCVGSQAQTEDELQIPVNELERTEDPAMIWRSFANNQLKGIYRDLFSLIDILIMLRAPDFGSVIEWRNLQESKLRSLSSGLSAENNKVMGKTELERFVMHYERITRATLDEMPSRADIVLNLNKQHFIESVHVK